MPVSERRVNYTAAGFPWARTEGIQALVHLDRCSGAS